MVIANSIRRRFFVVGALLVSFGLLSDVLSKPKKKVKEEVEIEFVTSPIGVKAKVIHGRKTFGVTPFKKKFPKNSGFRDVRVVAKGFLVLNTRFYTNNSHKRIFKLYTDEEAAELPGYKRKLVDASVESESVVDAGVVEASLDSGPAPKQEKSE